MPELPEVEVSRRGIVPHIQDQSITHIKVRHPQLRWPIPKADFESLIGCSVESVERRAKYLLLHTCRGDIVLHLGMSGSLRVLPAGTEAVKHDHLDIGFSNGKILRLNDPRRFGAALFQAPEEQLELFIKLGPEPLTDGFHPDYLLPILQQRKTAIKPVLMDNKVVVGVGNIYATEVLFELGIHPRRPANQITADEACKLVPAIKVILTEAIERGGTTLKDFTQPDSRPGYFAQELQIYGKKGQACPLCETILESCQLGQRASVYCPSCQA